MVKILLIEDDSTIARGLVYSLEQEGWNVTSKSTLQQGQKALEAERFDLLLADVGLPDGSGYELCTAAKKRGTPVIFVTALGDEGSVVLGLDLGADDYIVKPFRLRELASRIRAVLRRASKEEKAEEYQIGDLYVNPAKHVVKVKNEPITLTLKEFEVLCILIRHQGNVFTRAQLLDEIWGYEFDGESRTVDVHIRTLRQKLGEAGDCIETIRGVGYKIDAAR